MVLRIGSTNWKPKKARNGPEMTKMSNMEHGFSQPNYGFLVLKTRGFSVPKIEGLAVPKTVTIRSLSPYKTWLFWLLIKKVKTI